MPTAGPGGKAAPTGRGLAGHRGPDAARLRDRRDHPVRLGLSPHLPGGRLGRGASCSVPNPPGDGPHTGTAAAHLLGAQTSPGQTSPGFWRSPPVRVPGHHHLVHAARPRLRRGRIRPGQLSPGPYQGSPSSQRREELSDNRALTCRSGRWSRSAGRHTRRGRTIVMSRRFRTVSAVVRHKLRLGHAGRRFISGRPGAPGTPARSAGRPARKPGSAHGAGRASRTRRRSSCRWPHRPPAAAG